MEELGLSAGRATLPEYPDKERLKPLGEGDSGGCALEI